MFKSLRWRLQAWHAVVLLIVLTSFGGVVYTLHWQTRLQHVDAELHRTTNAVMSQFRRLIPRPMPRPQRRNDGAKPEAEPALRLDQNAVVKTDVPPNENDAEKPARPQEPVFPGRMFRDQGPPPPYFEQLFQGDEESRYYFIIWGRDGKVLQKSDSAPNLPYPDLHQMKDGLGVRSPRERRADHIYREVVTPVPWGRPPNEAAVEGPMRPSDLNVLVGRSLEKDIAAQHHSGFRLIAIGLVILVSGVLGAGWLSARAIRPIAAMTATAEAISAQNLSLRIDVKDTDSELGQLAKVLNGSFDRLQAAVERQRQFTADASHELRTPLSVIAAHTELALSRERSKEDYQATIETCLRASQRMKALIDSLLLLARFDSGTPLLQSARVNLDSLIRECVELVEPLATVRGIQIECQTTACHVSGDSERLIQVITNLLTNAIRYNVEGGSICVANRIESGSVMISVADTGLGIADDQLPRIFDRFYQVDKARSRAEGSCGLGLSICKTIVEAHGGAITANSQIGVGTTLEVRLPLADDDEIAGETESNEPRLATSLTEA